ncbi:arginine and glutamate-rich protein 1-like [Montipora capricornis]|uniref:arginine and glutamate-rich protein 1-like n=1 Tax=Montipora capricornis TaxID=246305 RepID=UPI0035F1B4BA
MVNNKKKKSTSNVPKSVGRGGSRVTRQIVNKEVSLNESPEVNTFQSDKNGGDMESRPSLAEGNVAGGPVVEHPEAPSGISRPTRTKVPSKTLNEEEVNAERAVHAKHQRAGHLRELRKRRNVAQDLITGPGVQLTEVEDAVERYEEAFHNFVSSHENCLRYEVDEEMRALMIDSYDNQRDLKLQSDVLVNDWRAKRKELERPPSESGLSLKSARSVKSYASSRNSVKKRKRLMEEAKLEMQALKEKQELQRELEEIEKGKAELSRKLELLDAKTKVQRTEMELMLEQSVEEETDGMNDYLKEYYMQNQLKKELLSQPDEPTVTPNSEAQPANGQETMAKGLPTVNGA